MGCGTTNDGVRCGGGRARRDGGWVHAVREGGAARAEWDGTYVP